VFPVVWSASRLVVSCAQPVPQVQEMSGTVEKLPLPTNSLPSGAVDCSDLVLKTTSELEDGRTSSFAPGLVVPMPTFPPLVTTKAVEPELLIWKS